MIVEPHTKKDDREVGEWDALEISCEIVTPVVTYGDGLPLDGLLAYGAYQEYVAEYGRYVLPHVDQCEWPVDFDLPLATWAMPPHPDDNPHFNLLTEDGYVWGWCASYVQASWEGRTQEAVRSKSPVNEAIRFSQASRVNTASGSFKGTNISYEARHTQTLTWHALGNADRIAALLKHVTHIGKHATRGYGKVTHDHRGVPVWRITRTDTDRSTHHDDTPTRPLPAEGGQHGRILTVRAPYHHVSRRILGVAPYDR